MPVANCHADGSSNVTCAGTLSPPTTYRNDCGPPTSAPVGATNGRHAARGAGSFGGSLMRYRIVTSREDARTDQRLLSIRVIVEGADADMPSRNRQKRSSYSGCAAIATVNVSG